MTDKFKARATITVVIEYDVDPKNYAGLDTPEEMMELDATGLDEDPYLWLDHAEAVWTTKIERVQGAANAQR